MTWFERRICTLEEAQKTSPDRTPGFFQLGDRARLWLDDTRQGDHTAVDCHVVGCRVAFGKLFYDVAIPLWKPGFCAVVDNVYAPWVTPPHVRTMPENPDGVEVTPEVEAQLRRECLTVVRSEADHASQAGVSWHAAKFGSSPTVVRLPLGGKYFTKPPVE